MLTRFEAKGFKLLRDVSVELTPLTVLVGGNGSGKTTLLDGIEWVLERAALGVWPPEDPLGGRVLDDVLSRPNAERLSIGLWHEQYGSLALELARPTGGPAAAREALAALARKTARPELNALPRVLRTSFDSRRLAEPSRAAAGRPKIEADGYGLPTVLQVLAGRRDGVIEEVEADLTRVVPTFRRIRTESIEVTWTERETVKFDEETIRRTVHRRGGGFALALEFDQIGWVPAAHVSEGTLLALGLIALLRADAPNLLLIDDIERGLHPSAQHAMMHLLREAIERSDDLQVIAATHSPYLVDACQPAEVRVFGRGGDGMTSVKSLTEHPEAEKWTALIETGEFWSTFGEEWVSEEAEEERRGA